MKFLKLLIVLVFSTSLAAQTRLSKSDVDSLPNTVENQFIKIFTKANKWQEYKMIKRTDFVSFQKSILDSVADMRKDALSKQQKINQQENTITSLNDKISELNNSLTTAIDKEDRIGFLGMQLKKPVYNTLMWGIIAGLLAGLLFFIYKFNSSNVLTREAQKGLGDVEQELEQFRKKAIEKEQKLRRQLQDEINKQRGI